MVTAGCQADIGLNRLRQGKEGCAAASEDGPIAHPLLKLGLDHVLCWAGQVRSVLMVLRLVEWLAVHTCACRMLLGLHYHHGTAAAAAYVIITQMR
jgi:hypothetical protein